MKKNVLFIVNDLNVGGIETYLLRFLKIYSIKINPIILCKSGNGGVLEDEYLKLNIKIIKIKMHYIPFNSLFKFCKLLKFYKVDTVCDFSGDFSGIPMFVSKLFGVHKRLSFYRGSSHRFKLSILKLKYNKIVNYLTYSCSTKILSNSEEALKFFHSSRLDNVKKFKVIRNGLPLNNFNNEIDENLRKSFNIPKNAFIIGHVGRFDSSKNHNTIFKTASNICKKYSHVYFLLSGLGVSNGLNNFEFADTKISNRIITPGLRSDVPELLGIMDAFYFPSITEGQPNALIEAMVCGLPFVSSNIATIKECVPLEYHKYLVSPNDVMSSVRLLSGFIKKDHEKDFINAKKYAKFNFNAIDKFKYFFDEL